MSTIQSIKITKTLSLLIFLVCCNAVFIDKALANMEQPALSCTLSFDKLPMKLNKVMLDFTLKNTSNSKLTLSKWYTPFEGFLSNLFKITNTDTGESLKYQGPMVKRLNPSAGDQFTLLSQSIMSTSMNLAQAYQFIPGNYQLTLKKNSFLRVGRNLSPSSIKCENTVVIFTIKD